MDLTAEEREILAHFDPFLKYRDVLDETVKENSVLKERIAKYEAFVNAFDIWDAVEEWVTVEWEALKLARETLREEVDVPNE